MLKKRLITVLCAIPVVIAAIWFDKPLPWFTLLVAIWGLAAAYEFYRLAPGTKVKPITYFGLIWTLLFILSPHCNYALTLPLLISSAVIISLVWLLFRPQQEGAFIGWAWTIAGILYLGWMLSHLVALRGLEDGRNWVFLALFATFASDSTALLVGKTLGRHALAPNVSPGKTWEGTIGGVLGAIIICLFFILPTPLGLAINYWQAIILGLLVSVFGQLGDLVESLLKRHAGVKDSGNLLPGHGGALDRIDSVVFASVVVYYYVIWIV